MLNNCKLLKIDGKTAPQLKYLTFIVQCRIIKVLRLHFDYEIWITRNCGIIPKGLKIVSLTLSRTGSYFLLGAEGRGWGNSASSLHNFARIKAMTVRLSGQIVCPKISHLRRCADVRWHSNQAKVAKLQPSQIRHLGFVYFPKTSGKRRYQTKTFKESLA